MCDTNGRFDKTRSLIVGGSGGIGRALTALLANAGSHVVCHGSRPERVNSLVGALRDDGLSADGLPWKILQLRPFVDAVTRCGPFDIVVAAYGPVAYEPLTSTSVDTWEEMAVHNLALPGVLLSRFLPEMMARGWGRFVLLGGTDTAEVRGFQTLPAYAAAKTGVSSLCKSAAIATAGSDVAVFSYLPGFVDTEYLSDSERIRLRRIAPKGRLDQPEDVARFVLRIAGESTEKVNGRLFSGQTWWESQ